MEGLLAETAAEMHRRMGGRGVAALMRERLHVSASQATADTELAAALNEFPDTLEAWRAGEISAGHARVIARVGADPEHCDEPVLLEMARGYPVDMFARMTRHYMKPGTSSAGAQPPAREPVGVAGSGPRRVLAAVGLLRRRQRQARQSGVQRHGAQLPQRHHRLRLRPHTGAHVSPAPRRCLDQSDHRRGPVLSPQDHAAGHRRLRHRGTRTQEPAL